jgi:hypothetical protein
MSSANDFTRHVPGFDFLQGLLKNAGASLPGVGQWIAPTLDPEELDKRIRDLKTVHFWLEQNAKLLATTIQALEVQRMTLSTLKSMNMPMADLAEALKARPAAPAPPPAPAPAPPPPPPPAAAAPAPEPQPAAAAAAAPLVDPMQWWGALTQQFTELAARAVKEGAEGPSTLPRVATRAGRPAGQGRAAAQSEGKAGAKAAAKPAEKATRQSAPKSARSASGGARPSASPRPRRSGT